MKRLFLSLLVFVLLLSACGTPQKGISEQILGSWQNSDGYIMEFRAAGSGFIPGVPGKIPDSTFTYVVMDESHISVVFQGHKNTIEIEIDGDQLTWKDNLGEVAYTRVK